MFEPRYYHDVEAIKSLEDIAEVNAHLKGGWELLKVAERTTTIAESDVVRTQTVLVYVLGLRAEGKSPPQAPSVATPPVAPPVTPATPPGVKACKFCSAPFYLAKEGERWLPKNPDGTPHRCKK